MHPVPQPGGRTGISDITTDDDLTIAECIERECVVGSTVGALSISEYRTELLVADFEAVDVTTTKVLGDGVHASGVWRDSLILERRSTSIGT